MKAKVKTFERGTIEQAARKVCEEAIEFYGAYSIEIQCEGCSGSETKLSETIRDVSLMLEIGDVITAIFNMCERLGLQAQDCVDLAQTKNLIRGYYGNPKEVALEWKRDTQEDTSSEQCGDSL